MNVHLLMNCYGTFLVARSVAAQRSRCTCATRNATATWTFRPNLTKPWRTIASTLSMSISSPWVRKGLKILENLFLINHVCFSGHTVSSNWCFTVDGPPMYPSRFVHMFPKQRDLMGFDEVRTTEKAYCFIITVCFLFFCLIFVCLLIKNSIWRSSFCPQIYLINLRRRSDRRDRMLFSLNELEVDVKVVDAVDGKWANAAPPNVIYCLFLFFLSGCKRLILHYVVFCLLRLSLSSLGAK